MRLHYSLSCTERDLAEIEYWFVCSPQPQDVNPESDWSTVFHAAQPFNPYHIPLPMRMGRAETGSVPPPALGNLELIKVYSV